MELPKRLYRLAVSLWIGGAALFTFVLTPAIFAHYDRDMAGGVVGVLFPGYFMWGLACGVVALLTASRAELKRTRLCVALLVFMLAASAFQYLVIEPRVAAIKRQIPSFMSTPPDHPLRKEFRAVHGVSSALNLGVVGSGALLILLL